MISTEISRNSYIGNGTQYVFDYTFKIFANTDLKVYVNNVLKTLTTHYTVNGAGLESGTRNVTFVITPTDYRPANLAKVEIFRSVPLTQLTDYVANDNFPAETHENTLDKIVQQIQMLKDMFGRMPKWAVGTDESTDLGLAPAVANALLKWSADGKSITSGAGVGTRIQVYRSGTPQTITPGSNKIQLNSIASVAYVDYLDALGEFDNVTNFRFVPQVSGAYLVIANAAFPYLANAGRMYLYLNKTGQAAIAAQHTSITATPSSGRASVSAIVQLTPADYIELWVNNEMIGNTEAVVNVTKMEIIRLW